MTKKEYKEEIKKEISSFAAHAQAFGQICQMEEDGTIRRHMEEIPDTGDMLSKLMDQMVSIFIAIDHL